MRKKLLFLFVVMLTISLLSFLTVYISDNHKKNITDKSRIVTSFYPMYVLTLNIVNGVDDIELVNMTENATGCLHDYQLTTKDMRTVEGADVFVISGGGMESFVDDIKAAYPTLPVIDTSAGIELLEGNDHHHDDETQSEADIHEDITDETEHSEDKEANAHVWMSIPAYIRQVENTTASLSEFFPQYADAFAANSAAYTEKLRELETELPTEAFAGEPIIIFHEAFAYLADSLNMEVVHSVEVDSDTAMSAGELAEVLEDVREEGVRFLFTEEQYSTSIADAVSKESDAQTVVIDSLVTGDGDKDSYIEGMRKNIQILRSLLHN